MTDSRSEPLLYVSGERVRFFMRLRENTGPTHVLFDFFGTLVAYDDDWTSQTYPRTHRLLLDAGAELSYEDFVSGMGRVHAALAERFTLVLLSNTHRAELVRSLLGAIGAEPHFHEVVTSVEHGKRKPSPIIFRDAVAAAGGSAERAVYVGDNYAADYQGAAGAGLRCLLIDPDSRHPIPEEDRLNHVLETASHLIGMRSRGVLRDGAASEGPA